MYKQAIVIRSDLKLPKGKLAVQVAHASVENVIKLLNKGEYSLVKDWRDEGMKKVVLKVDSFDELIKKFNEAKSRGFLVSLIKDAGKTVVEPGTVTCFAIGPDKEEKIDEITKDLKLV